MFLKYSSYPFSLNTNSKASLKFDFDSKNIDPKQLSRFGLNGREKNPENEFSVRSQLMPYPSKIKDRNPYFFAIDVNVLIALVQPYELSNYVDMNLVNPEDREKVKQLTEESNPVIVRYYLK